MKKLILLLLLPFLIPSQMFAQLASDYFPLHVGDYWVQHTDTISFDYLPTTIRKDIEALDVILGEEYFRMKKNRATDDGSSESTSYYWFREDSTGILLGGFGNSSVVASATILDPPILWLPNGIVNAGYTWDFNCPEMGGHFSFSIGGINDTVEMPAGTFNDCLRTHEMVVNASGDTTQMNLIYYAEGIGEISDFQYLVDVEFYEVELVEYYVSYPVGVINSPSIPSNFCLLQNYPNPFNPVTNIQYSVPNLEFIQIKIFDILGKEIITLINEEKYAGTYNVEFNATNLSSGVYFYIMKAGSFLKTNKLLLIK